MIIKQLGSPPSVVVATGGGVIYQNSAASGVREIVQVTFNNIDGVNDAALSSCQWTDASNGNNSYDILPKNVKVAKFDSVTVTKTLDPGDRINASASAADDIIAIVEIVGREAV